MDAAFQNFGRCSKCQDVITYCSCQRAVELRVEFLNEGGQVVQFCYVDAESREAAQLKCAEILSRGIFPGSASYRLL